MFGSLLRVLTSLANRCLHVWITGCQRACSARCCHVCQPVCAPAVPEHRGVKAEQWRHTVVITPQWPLARDAFVLLHVRMQLDEWPSLYFILLCSFFTFIVFSVQFHRISKIKSYFWWIKFNIDSDVTYWSVIMWSVVSYTACPACLIICFTADSLQPSGDSAATTSMKVSLWLYVTQFGPNLSCGTDVLVMVYRGVDGPLSDCEELKPSRLVWGVCADVFGFLFHGQTSLWTSAVLPQRRSFSCSTSKAAVVVKSFLSVLSWTLTWTWDLWS